MIFARFEKSGKLSDSPCIGKKNWENSWEFLGIGSESGKIFSEFGTSTLNRARSASIPHLYSRGAAPAGRGEPVSRTCRPVCLAHGGARLASVPRTRVTRQQTQTNRLRLRRARRNCHVENKLRGRNRALPSRQSDGCAPAESRWNYDGIATELFWNQDRIAKESELQRIVVELNRNR